MGGLILGPTRYVLVPWGDIEPSDLREGQAVLTRDIRNIRKLGRGERHLCMPVMGEYVPQLGMMAIRCERHSGWELPLSMALVDTAIAVNTDEGGD